jgi:hypothetical protein
MISRILLGSFLCAMAVLVSIGAALSVTGRADTANAREEQLVTVMNPAISNKMVERIPLGPRADTLEGKTIYMVDLQWGGPDAAYSVYEEMQHWFSRNMPSVKTVIRRSSGGPFGDDPGLRKEIAENGAGGVIIGIGG